MLRLIPLFGFAASVAAEASCPASCLLQMLETDPKTGFVSLNVAAKTANPCGCNFVKSTSRDDLRVLSEKELTEKIAKLQKETDEAEASLNKSKEDHKKMVEKKEKMIKTREEKILKLDGEITKEHDDQAAKRRELSEKNAALEKKMHEHSSAISADRVEITNLSQELMVLIMKLEGCPKCAKKGAKFLATEAKLQKITEVTQQPQAVMKKVLEFEKIENKFGKIQKEQTELVSEQGTEIRILDSKIENLDAKVGTLTAKQSSDGAMNKNQLERVQKSKKLLKKFSEKREEAVKQSGNRLDSIKKQIETLKKQLAECGCN